MKNIKTLFDENYEFLQTIIDAMPNPVFYKDVHGIFRYCNKEFASYLGLETEQIIGHSAYDFCPKELADLYRDTDLALIQDRKKKTYEAQVEYADKSIRDILFTKGVVLNKDDSIMGLIGSMVDVTKQKKIEKRNHTLLKQKESIIDISHAILEMNDIKMLLNISLDKVIEFMDHKENLGCILILDNEGNLRINASRGYTGDNNEDFVVPLSESFFWLASKGKLDKPVVINNIHGFMLQNFVGVLTKEDGVHIESSISIPILLEGKLYGLINIDSIFNNNFDKYDLKALEYIRNQIEIGIAKQNLYEETLELSRFDKLTGLYNRRYFEERVSQTLEKSKRYNENFSLVCFDIDGLKTTNDQYGHAVGDEIIKYISSQINSKMRRSDIFARYGGDEFTAIYFDTTAKDLIDKLQEMRDEIVQKPLLTNNCSISCSYSYGIARFPNDGTSFAELMEIADSNMYKDKNEHKEHILNQITQK